MFGFEIKRIMMWSLIVLNMIMSLAIAQKATFENYKVFSIMPTTQSQFQQLYKIVKFHDGFSFWNIAGLKNKIINLMVAPHKLPQFHEIMAQIGVSYQINIKNVQKLIDQTMPANRSMSFDFNSYHTLDEIYKNLDDLTERYPDNVQIIIGGRTYEGRQIKGVKVSFTANNPGIFLEGGIHAKEWISPATVMYILHQVLTSKDADVRALAESHDWYIFPVFNPDGYVYTHTTNRMWRKTRKPSDTFCIGVDLNRNWGYRWNKNNTKPCSNGYAGSAPFSEIETRSISRYIKTISNKFYAYIAFHSHAQLLLFPYGHTKDHLDNYDELYAIGLKTIAALKKRYGTEYHTGNIAETIYKVTGSSVDYIKATYGKQITYIYELRDRDCYGYLLPPDQIIPTGEEVVDSLVVMFKEAKAHGHPFRNF
ncbi:zinc carboxypeptidase-like [Formica exsecta]|uniref:zinc carboxypeptidase-like n=1 Tax=Formica exsecta TaxID=72781 RepID=UPI0011447E27|nr:zinc carboxypeptidase-like [Formica exsecta]